MLQYVRRGITRRKRNTAIISIGMALAVAAVMIVSAASTGIANAQSNVLQSIYGVGTDITVTASSGGGGDAQSGGNQIQFGQGAGSTGSDGSTQISTTQLSVSMGTQTIEASDLATVTAISGVSDATGTLALTQTDFSGMIDQQDSSGSTDSGSTQTSPSGAPGGGGGGGGFGGGTFNLDQTTVLGVDPSATDVGPLSDMTVSDGALLTADDAETSAVISASYASDNGLSVGSTFTLGEATEATVVGILSEDSSQSSSDIYIPLSLAQSVSGETDKLTTIYVSAVSADNVDTLASDLGSALPDLTISTQSDLASSVTGSLSSASSWISGFGKWLTIGILALAFLLTSLFTIASVSRRTRELGTLKAIGWSNGRVVSTVVSESLIQTLLGGALGIIIGAIAILGINAAGITLSGATGLSSSGAGMPAAGQQTTGTSGQGGGQGAPAGGSSGMGGQPGSSETTSSEATETSLTLEPSVSALALAVGASVLGGVVAGGAGALKVTRLRPAAALRSVD